MSDRPPAPASLKIVAALFILGGLSSALDALIRLTQGTLFLNLGILGLFIGIGLLRYSRGWRVCALVFLWLAMVGFPLAGFLLVATDQPVRFTLFGQEVSEVPKTAGVAVAGVAVAAVGFALALWRYRVLTRPRVRQLFGLSAE